MTSPLGQPPGLDRLLSDSALSKQLTTLRKDGYVDQRRTYLGRVPKTTVQATDRGRHRLLEHIEALRTIVEQAPRPNPGPPA